MPRTLNEIQADIQAFEHEIELLDRDHDGHADDPRFEQRIHDIEGRLQLLAREFSQVLQQSRQTNVPPQQQQQNPPQQQNPLGTVNLSVSQQREVRPGVNANITITPTSIAASLAAEKKFWEAKSKSIPVFSLGGIPIVLTLGSTGKGKAELKDNINTLTGVGTLSAELSFTATGEVSLAANFAAFQIGGRATITCAAKSGAQITVANNAFNWSVTPFTAGVELELKLFAEPINEIKTILEALGVRASWEYPLAKYELLKINVPTITDGRVQGEFSIAPGKDVAHLQQQMQNAYNTVKNAVESAAHSAERLGEEAVQTLRGWWNRL